MWISAKFHLQVIRAYDRMVTATPVQTFQVPQTMGQALALAADISAKLRASRHPLHAGCILGFQRDDGGSFTNWRLP